MIYCNLKGGLGNMMFQIATAKAFAIDVGDECSFPNLEENLCLIDKVKYDPLNGGAGDHTSGSGSIKLLGKLRTDPIVDNPGYEGFPIHYEEKTVKPNTIIDGFFQSEKYFKRHRQAILELFDFSFVTDEFIQQKYPFLKDKKTTSIHIRRGDYLTKPQCHPPQTLEYYQQGMELLKDRTDLFVISSDDMEWCKNSFTGDNVFFLDDEVDYIEIYLMSLCNNNIICNSSFGWWAAWLNQNEDKMVIGPKIWFGPALAGHDTSDILPSDWIKL